MLGKANNKIYSKLRQHGLIRFSKLDFDLVNSSVKEATLHFYLSHKDSALIGSEQDGLLLLKGNSLLPWNTTTNNILKTKHVNCGVALSSGGFAMINPDFMPSDIAHELYFSKVKVSNSQKRTSYHLPVRQKGDAILKIWENDLSFCFNNRTVDVHKSKFQYRLLPIQQNWVDVEKGNAINLHQLSHGNCQLDVRLIDDSGAHSDVITYKFRILSFWLSYYYISIGIFFTICFSLFLTVKAYKRKTREITEYHQSKLHETEQKVRILKTEIQQQILENLQNKLTTSANELLKRDEAIKLIKDELTKIYTKLKGRFPHKDYNLNP